MKNKVVFAFFIGLLLVAVVLIARFAGGYEHDPRDLSYWIRAGADKDWSSEAAQGQPQAQFYCGLGLISSNVVIMIDQVPRLCDIPIIGKRFFEHTSYGINSSMNQEQLAEAHRWIKKSADQGYAPAREAEKLFIGRVGKPTGGAANRSQPIRSETNQTFAEATAGQVP
jgi:hypothetical protein